MTFSVSRALSSFTGDRRTICRRPCVCQETTLWRSCTGLAVNRSAKPPNAPVEDIADDCYHMKKIIELQNGSNTRAYGMCTSLDVHSLCRAVH